MCLYKISMVLGLTFKLILLAKSFRLSVRKPKRKFLLMQTLASIKKDGIILLWFVIILTMVAKDLSLSILMALRKQRIKNLAFALSPSVLLETQRMVKIHGVLFLT